MKIGFIGGNGHHYLQGLLQNAAGDQRTFEIAVAGDGHDDESSRALWKRLGGQWFDDATRMLDEFKPAAVSVGAVYAFNGDWAAAAMERDIPVVSDKPIAASWDQFDRLQSLAAENSGRILLTEFDFRTQPSFLAARAAVGSGKIGTPILISAQKSYRFGTRPAWYRDRASYGGTLMWVAAHAVDVIPFITGQKLIRATGHGGNLSHPDFASMEDHVAAMFVLSGGGTAIVHADFLRPAAAKTHGDDRLRIAGSEGIIEIIGGRCRLITSTVAEIDLTDSAAARPIHEELFAALNGQSSDLFSTAESLETARLLLRAREAVDAGKWVDLAS